MKTENFEIKPSFNNKIHGDAFAEIVSTLEMCEWRISGNYDLIREIVGIGLRYKLSEFDFLWLVSLATKNILENRECLLRLGRDIGFCWHELEGKK
jgi:hypothetical protein